MSDPYVCYNSFCFHVSFLQGYFYYFGFLFSR
jgi:hypothetical protein